VIPLRRAIGAFIAAALLSGCSGGFTPPAATVNGVRISQAAVEDRLEAALADPDLAAQVSGSNGPERRADLARQVLALLIRQQVIGRYAAGHDIAVSTTEVEQALSDAIDQIGGRPAFDRELRIRGLTIGDVRENIRQALLGQKVQQAVVQGSGAPANVTQQQASVIFGQWLEGQLRRSDIEVNPRFGAFDLKQLTVCRIASTAGDVACPQQ
jgi:hypothetical protein